MKHVHPTHTHTLSLSTSKHHITKHELASLSCVLAQIHTLLIANTYTCKHHKNSAIEINITGTHHNYCTTLLTDKWFQKLERLNSTTWKPCICRSVACLVSKCGKCAVPILSRRWRTTPISQCKRFQTFKPFVTSQSHFFFNLFIWFKFLTFQI